QDALGVEVAQQAADEVIDAVLAELSVPDQVLVARQAGDADDCGDALVDGAEPPRARAPHRHAGCPDPRAVDLGPARQVVERDLVVADEHAPKRPPQPEVELQETLLLVAPRLETPRRSGADAVAVPER